MRFLLEDLLTTRKFWQRIAKKREITQKRNFSQMMSRKNAKFAKVWRLGCQKLVTKSKYFVATWRMT